MLGRSPENRPKQEGGGAARLLVLSWSAHSPSHKFDSPLGSGVTRPPPLQGREGTRTLWTQFWTLTTSPPPTHMRKPSPDSCAPTFPGGGGYRAPPSPQLLIAAFCVIQRVSRGLSPATGPAGHLHHAGGRRLPSGVPCRHPPPARSATPNVPMWTGGQRQWPPTGGALGGGSTRTQIGWFHFLPQTRIDFDIGLRGGGSR